jgi:hypothetical protein
MNDLVISNKLQCFLTSHGATSSQMIIKDDDHQLK